jgi:hypothetical protein
MHGLTQIERMNRDAARDGGAPVQNFTPDVRAYLAAHPLCTIVEAIKACEELPAAIAQQEAEYFDYQQVHEDITQ